MSIVGTRPPLISETNLYEPHHKATKTELQERFALIYTGQRRLARNLLRDVVGNYIGGKKESKEALEEMKHLAVMMRYELEQGDVNAFAKLLNEHWEVSKKLDAGSTNTCIDQIFASRVKNIGSYFIGAMGATFKVGKMDYVFSISQPPILGGLLGVWGKWMKHAKYIYNIQDFNPEQVLAVGYTKSKFITDAMMWFDKFSCKRSDLVITVGRDLVETVENRFKGKKVPKTVMINNWIDENEIYPLDENNEKVQAFKKKYGLDGKFVIMYSGNIGLYYDLENLIKVVERIKPGTKTADGREVVFAFVGAGSVLDKLVLYAKEHHMDNVTFIPYQDKADLIYSLNAGDVHWCVNAKGIKGVSCPSNVYLKFSVAA